MLDIFSIKPIDAKGIIKNAEELQGYEFGPVKFRRENERFWVFSAGSGQLFEEGYVPGAVYACIDKIDGHVWSLEEQERYAQSLSVIRQAAASDSIAA